MMKTSPKIFKEPELVIGQKSKILNEIKIFNWKCSRLEVHV
jgi:hypothetical protein